HALSMRTPPAVARACQVLRPAAATAPMLSRSWCPASAGHAMWCPALAGPAVVVSGFSRTCRRSVRLQPDLWSGLCAVRHLQAFDREPPRRKPPPKPCPYTRWGFVRRQPARRRQYGKLPPIAAKQRELQAAVSGLLKIAQHTGRV